MHYHNNLSPATSADGIFWSQGGIVYVVPRLCRGTAETISRGSEISISMVLLVTSDSFFLFPFMKIFLLFFFFLNILYNRKEGSIFFTDSFKPTVAHRDINSRNVLVKPDLSLVIADLGFCMTTMGSKLIHKGHTENAEQTSLTDVSNYIESYF